MMNKGQRVRSSSLEEPFRHELYLPEGSGPFPLLCLTPLLGQLAFFEDCFLERRFARFFAAHGFAAALIHRTVFEFDPARGLEQIQDYLDQSIARNQRVLDSLLLRKEIDAGKIGTYGISFGAVLNSLWAAADPRLQAHVFALGGGNLPEIFVTSRDPLMRRYMKDILKCRGGVSTPTINGRGDRAPTHKDDLKSALQKIFRFDPLEAARSIPREKVCLHLAVFDRVIRFRCGLEFRRALGNPETVFIPLGHYSSLLAVPFLRRQVLEFFRRKLNPVLTAS